MDSENRTADFEDAANITVDITVDIVSIIPQGKQSGDEEDRQVNPYKENEANKSNEENSRKKIEQTAINQVEKLRAKKIKPRTIKLKKLQANNNNFQAIKLIYTYASPQ